MADSYTREQIVRKLKRLKKKYRDLEVRLFVGKYEDSSWGAYLQAEAIEFAIAAFPPKGSKK